MNNLTKKPGLIMLILAWVAGLYVFTQFFASEQEKANNPNSNVETIDQSGLKQIKLVSNRQGHFVVSGLINDAPGVFMLDTGATDVVIPAELASYYNLSPLGKQIGLTANGHVEIEKTNIDKLSIGAINLYNVRASINPGMHKSQPILLGMSAIKRFDLTTQDNTLTLTYRP